MQSHYSLWLALKSMSLRWCQLTIMWLEKKYIAFELNSLDALLYPGLTIWTFKLNDALNNGTAANLNLFPIAYCGLPHYQLHHLTHEFNSDRKAVRIWNFLPLPTTDRSYYFKWIFLLAKVQIRAGYNSFPGKFVDGTHKVLL